MILDALAAGYGTIYVAAAAGYGTSSGTPPLYKVTIFGTNSKLKMS
jgi:hypothetical protein